MVACPKCVINNTLDSAFCKKCGAVLPISMIEEEQEKLKEIVTKGMESYQTGNLDEAMAIADHSILTNPSYGEAYALKGLIHERKGAYAEALDAYETVVALNPDSTIDKIKLNQLRNAFAQRQAGEPAADRRGAALIAAAVTVACLAIGGISYGIMQTSKETKSNVAATNTPDQPRNELLANRENTTQQPGINPGVGPRDNSGVGALGSDNNPEIDSRPRIDTPRGGSRSNFGGNEPVFVDPGTPNGPINPKPGPTLPRNNPGGNDSAVIKQPPVNTPPTKPPVTPPDEDPPVSPGGTIDIQISKPKTDPNAGKGGSDPSAGGGNTGKSFQRQGLAHQRSGKNAQAREAYQKAIDAFQKDIDSGKGDKEAAMAGINSSKQALKNIKD